MAFLLVTLLVLVFAAGTAGVLYVMTVGPPAIRKKSQPKSVEKKKVLWADITDKPDGFFNLVRDALPKDLGLIYEIEVVEHVSKARRHYSYDFLNGEMLVVVKAYDPITDKEVGDWKYSERLAKEDFYSDETTRFCQLVEKNVRNTVLKNKKDALKGHKEIIS